MATDRDLIRDLEQEIGLLAQENTNSPAVMKVVSAFFTTLPHQYRTAEERKKKAIPKAEIRFPHKPKDVADFMNLFDKASGLKYLTHDFDEVDNRFLVRDFLIGAKRVFIQYTHKYIIPASLWRIIDQFAFQKSPKWFSFGKVVQEGWSSEKWIQWSERDGYPSKNYKFREIIKKFKDQTRLKTFPEIIELVIDNKFSDKKVNFNFDFIRLNKFDVYTHVDSIVAGLEYLFDEIYDRPKLPNVTIQVESKAAEDYRIRIIHIYHHDSYPVNKSIKEVFEKYCDSGGNLWEARQRFFGYCDWYIETIWDGKPTRIHLLKEGMVSNQVEIEIEN